MNGMSTYLFDKETADTLLQPQIERFCGCGCGRSLWGYRSNRKYHPDCKPRIDAERREKRERERHDRIYRKFLSFHADNPHVYVELTRMARQLASRGIKRYGIKALIEVLRWKSIKTTGEDYKINNNFTAYYARLIMEEEPDLDGFFKIRGGRA